MDEIIYMQVLFQIKFNLKDLYSLQGDWKLALFLTSSCLVYGTESSSKLTQDLFCKYSVI